MPTRPAASSRLQFGKKPLSPLPSLTVTSQSQAACEQIVCSATALVGSVHTQGGLFPLEYDTHGAQ